MAEYIEREMAIALIEEKQKELCPVGRYGRGYVYGTDRERYDNWGEIIDALSAIPAADAAPVRHGRWELDDGKKHCHCTVCFFGRNIKTQIGWNFCPNCGRKMMEDLME